MQVVPLRRWASPQGINAAVKYCVRAKYFLPSLASTRCTCPRVMVRPDTDAGLWRCDETNYRIARARVYQGWVYQAWVHQSTRLW